MLIVREHQRDGEDGTNVDAVICKSGPVDRSKFNGDGVCVCVCLYGFSHKHPNTWIGRGSSYLRCKVVEHLGDGGLQTPGVRN